jgi:hypothetical protein
VQAVPAGRVWIGLTFLWGRRFRLPSAAKSRNPQTVLQRFCRPQPHHCLRTRFAREDGLPSSIVNAILHTRNGFLWGRLIFRGEEARPQGWLSRLRRGLRLRDKYL